jgi:murein DD-endopeptidase MepM/ murein hydrolase activator NlpD
MQPVLAHSEPMGPRTELISSDTLDRALAAATAHSKRFASAHPRGVSGAVMLALAGFGVTAFGISPLAFDAAQMPQRLVTESVTPSDIQSQLDALAEHDLQLYRTDLTRAADTADSLLKRLNVSDPNAAAFLRIDPTARQLLNGRGGKMVRVQTDENGKLTELVARYAPADAAQLGTQFTRLRVERVAGKLTATVTTAPLAAQVRMGSGTIRSSLFAATDEARIPDSIATQLTEVFATDVDFHRQLRKGDTFSVVYEALTADGEPITWGASTAGRVLAAEFVNNGRSHSAMWFKDAQNKGAYYGLDGKSKTHAFLASPLEFSRVTSGFAMRMHPILNNWKQHKGVDYHAPSGTAIRAIGEGTVDFAGWQNGYGNVVEIKHSAQRSTLYAHMSRIDVKLGARVEQGQHIGAVGATGWATGPHLHFEVKMNGVQEDPMILARSAETTELSAAAKAQFTQIAKSLKGQLEVADTVGRSGSYAE